MSLEIQPLKTTILLASKEAAEEVSANMLMQNTGRPRPIVRREPTEHGFKLLMPLKNAEGKTVWSRVFEFHHISNKPLGRRVDYDPRIITILEHQPALPPTTRFLPDLHEIERAIVTALVTGALQAGYAVSVDNGGDEPEIEKSTDLRAILAEMFATSCETLLFYDPNLVSDDPRPDGFVELVYGNEGYNVMADYNGFCERFMGPAQALADEYEQLAEVDDERD